MPTTQQFLCGKLPVRPPLRQVVQVQVEAGRGGDVARG